MAEENLGRAVLALTTDDAGIDDGLKKAKGKASSWVADVGGVLGKGLMIGAGVAAAAGGLIAGALAEATSAAMDAERVTAQLESTLKATGGVAGMTRESVEALSLALSTVTPVEDDVITGAQSMLLTFKNIGRDIFPTATEAVLDMATAMNRGAIPSAEALQGVAIQLGKALNDPTVGMTALSRAGVTFSESQKATIKALQESGDLMGAQKIILQELQSEFGGAARAAGGTFAGQMAILNNQFGNMKEEVGGALLPALSELMTALGPSLAAGAQVGADFLVNSVIPAVKEAALWVQSDLVPAVQDLATWLGVNVVPALSQFATWLGVNLPPAIATATTVLTAFWQQIIVPVAGALKTAWDNTVGFVSAIGPAMQFSDGWSQFVEIIRAIADAVEAANAAVQRLIASINAAIGAQGSLLGSGTGTPGGQAPTNPRAGGPPAPSVPGTGGRNFAGGTSFAPGGLSLVGELGPELVNLPRGSRVFSAAETAGLLGGALRGNYQFSITINTSGDGRAVAWAAEQGVLSAARALGMR